MMSINYLFGQNPKYAAQCWNISALCKAKMATHYIQGVHIQSRPSTTRLIIRRIGCNAVDRASRFFCRQGEYVEIMVNNVTVILVVRDTCKINTTSTARTVHVRYPYRVMSEVITIARLDFGCGIVSTVDLDNNTTRRHECVPQRMFAWLTINTMLCVPYRTDSDTVTVR